MVRTHQSHSWEWVPSLVGELLTQCTKRKKKGRLGENNCSRLLLLLLKATLSVTPRTAAHQASLSSTIFWSLLKLMSIEPVMLSNHLILCHPLLLPSVFPSIRGSSNELALHIRWPKDWCFSFSISPSNEYPGLISFRIG